MNLESSEKNLGYEIEEPREGERPGFHRLEIHLTNPEEPGYFKIAEVELPIFSSPIREGVQQHSTLSVTTAWKRDKEYQVLPGTVTLYLDHVPHQNPEFFTFGGSIRTRGDLDFTHCRLRSPAPIFQRADEDNLTEFLVEEVELHLAQEHAKWGKDDAGFWHRVAVTEPETLYRACLKTLHDKFNRDEYQNLSDAKEIKSFLDREISPWKVDELPTLASTLSPQKPSGP